MNSAIAGGPWLVAACVACTVGLGMLVRHRVGVISRLSWLDAAMGALSMAARPRRWGRASRRLWLLPVLLARWP